MSRINILKRIIITILFVVCFFNAKSQIYRVSSVRGGGQSEFAIYEAGYVDVLPSFPGGESALIKFINETRRYPEKAYFNKVQGRVMCKFIVYPDGSINKISVIKGVEDSLDEEAVRIIREMPRWESAKHKGRAVPVYYVLAIPFRL